MPAIAATLSAHMWLLAVVVNNAEIEHFHPLESAIGQHNLRSFQQQDGTIQGFPNQLGQKISVGRIPRDLIWEQQRGREERVRLAASLRRSLPECISSHKIHRPSC